MKEAICFLSGSCYRWMRLLHRGPMQTKVGEVGSKLGSNYQPLFGKMSPHSSPREEEDQRLDPGDGGNRAYLSL